MNRVKKHNRAVRAFLSILEVKLPKIKVKTPDTQPNSYDLLIGFLKIAVRVAYPHVRHHTVTVGGKRYSYSYMAWAFNFHAHGIISNPHFFICIARQHGPRNSTVYYIVPNRRKRKTLSFTKRRKGYYSGQFAKYRDNWELLQSAARQTSLNPSRL